MTFQLPKLPFEPTALEPFINSKTISFHYGKHHQAYVNNLNKLIAGTSYESQSLEEIIKTSEDGIFNNAAQVWNHTFYWESLCPAENSTMPDALKKILSEEFGSVETFKEEFTKAALSLFGSGWTWLVKTKTEGLKIISTSNAGSPLVLEHSPLLTCDVWEHAYYLDYQNKRPDYVAAFWNIVNWEKVLQRFE